MTAGEPWAVLPWLWAGAIGLQFGVARFFDFLDHRELRRWERSPPPELAGTMDDATYQRSVAYTRARLRLGAAEEAAGVLLTLGIGLGGVLPAVFGWATGDAGPPAWWAEVLAVLAIGALFHLASLPWDFAGQFGIEARFGFNRSSRRLWLVDKVKEALLAAGLGFLVLAGLLALVRWAGGNGWWLGWLLLLGWQLGLMVLYPRVILPWFNRLSPLPEGELRQRLLEVAARAGFPARRIEVIDGSRRSSHGNAFFTGFGRFRRIVFYDTLLQALRPEEIAAVLAHEIGHWRRGHIPRQLALSALLLLGGLYAADQVSRSPEILGAFGLAPEAGVGAGLVLFVLLAGPVGFALSPLLHAVSRQAEYEADAFARETMGSPEPLISALRRLTESNLSNLTPHPWSSAFHHSHPTLRERELALRRA